jgi:hypothetical protein
MRPLAFAGQILHLEIACRNHMKAMTLLRQKFHSLDRGARLALWGTFGAILIAAGFLVDGSTETGHHLFLILGGAIIGAGAMREIRG